jgi:hypothetical protein
MVLSPLKKSSVQALTQNVKPISNAIYYLSSRAVAGYFLMLVNKTGKHLLRQSKGARQEWRRREVST